MKIGYVYKYESQEKKEWVYELRCDKEMLEVVDEVVCESITKLAPWDRKYTTKELEEISNLSKALLDIRKLLEGEKDETDCI